MATNTSAHTAATAATAAPRLSRRRIGVLSLFFFTVAASAPMTVLAGGITTTFAVTGIAGVPLSFIILGVALGLFSVGYAAMSRYVANAGAFYSYLANGLGRESAVGGAFVALVSYNAIQIGLYGLFGYSIRAFIIEKTNFDMPWWAWALCCLVVIGALGAARIDLNARVLAVFLTCEVIAVIVYDIVAFAHPAGGSVSADGLKPSNLFVHGLGAVFAFSVAAFIGFESGASYSEECLNPKRTVARATYCTIAFTAVFYALSAWAMASNVGSDQLQKAAGENGPGLVFGVLGQYTNSTVADIANVLFLTSVFAALLSFHNAIARYLFALGRERVLPKGLARVGARTGGPLVGSLVQTTLALIVVVLFALAHADPILKLFTWFSGMSAVGVILLMTGTSAGVIGFFRKRRNADENAWQRAIAPALATIALGALVVLLIANFDSLLGTDPNSPLRWVLPAIVLASAVGGVIWGAILRNYRPDVYEGIGRAATGFHEGDADEPSALDLSAMRW
jgi:amino acid transporter